MQATLIEQGAELMLVGMGTVFVFLTVLVVATSMMSRIVGRLIPEPLPEPPSMAPGATEASGEEVAAIAAAILRHRSAQPNRVDRR